jgi:hypothetical protein
MLTAAVWPLSFLASVCQGANNQLDRQLSLRVNTSISQSTLASTYWCLSAAKSDDFSRAFLSYGYTVHSMMLLPAICVAGRCRFAEIKRSPIETVSNHPEGVCGVQYLEMYRRGEHQNLSWRHQTELLKFSDKRNTSKVL